MPAVRDRIWSCAEGNAAGGNKSKLNFAWIDTGLASFTLSPRRAKEPRQGRDASGPSIAVIWPTTAMTLPRTGLASWARCTM